MTMKKKIQVKNFSTVGLTEVRDFQKTFSSNEVVWFIYPDPDRASATVSLSLSERDNQGSKSSNLDIPHVLTKGPVVDHSPKKGDRPAWESYWQMSPPGVPGTP